MHAVIFGSDIDECPRLTSYLAQAGYAVVAAASIDEACDAAQRPGNDIVIVEHKLSQRCSITTCYELRRRLGGRHILIMVDSAATPDLCATAIEMGADDCVANPCDPEELLARLEARDRRRRWTLGNTLQHAALRAV